MKDEIAQFQAKIQKLQEENKILNDNLKNFYLLNNMFSELLKLKDLEQIYLYISGCLQNHIPNSIVLYVSIDEQVNETKLECIEGINNNLLKRILSISGFNPIGKTYKLLPKHNDYFRAGKLVEFKGGLAEFSASEFPDMIAHSIEKLIGLYKIYTIGIVKDENLLAAIHFLTFSKQTITDSFFIETFVKQAGIILQKKIAENALFESEKYIRTILESEPECVKIIDRDGKLEYLNPAGIKMIEANSLEQVRGMPVLPMVTEAFRVSMENLISKTFAGVYSKLEYEAIGING